MKSIFTILLFTILTTNFLQAQYRYHSRAQVFEKYEPGVEVGRAILPGMLAFMGGAMRTDTQRGRVVQLTLFFGAGVAVGAWKDRGRTRGRKVLICLGAGLAGAALGFAVNPK